MQKGKVGFLREATGLVRELTFFDFVAMNFGAAAITAGLLTANYSAWLYPNGSIPIGIILTGLLMMGTQLVVYALFAASMPRTGGDYVFISRTLNPALGFAANFTAVWSNLWVIGASTVYTEFNLSGAVVSIAMMTNNRALTDFGLALTSPLWTFAVGAITIIILTVVSILRTKYLMRIIVGLFVVGLVGLVVSLAALLTFKGDFVSVFNQFAAPYTGTTDSYQHVIQATQNAGFFVGQPTLGDTIKTIPLQLGWLAFAYWSTYNIGEFKRAADVKRQYGSMAGILLFNTVLTAVLVFVLESIIGHQFFASMSYAFAALPQALPLPTQPSFNLFAGMVTGSPYITAIGALGTIAIGISLTAILYPMLTRCLFAWSFDRLLPAKVADTHPRFGTPYVAILVCSTIGLISLAINSFVAPSLFFYISFGTVWIQIAFNFTITSIAAGAFPFLRKDVYNASPAKKYHPLIIIAGLASAVLFGWAGFQYFTDPGYGITVPWLYAYLLGIFVAPLLAYYVISAYRKSRGTDISLLFKEIPPE